MKNIYRINQKEEELLCREITVEEFAKSLDLLTIFSSKKPIKLSTLSVNRPGLFFTGFSEYFASSRVQVIGNAEIYYLNSLDRLTKNKILESFFKTGIPCVIIARNLKIEDDVLEIAKKYDTPVFSTGKITSDIINELQSFLNIYLSETGLISGELLDINGVGVLITGKSGLGKSETALDLITRGHKLVADDVVFVKKVKNELIGMAPEKTRFYMEVRGIGIIDVRSLYGVGSVLYDKKIDIVIEFKQWTSELLVDRIGDTQNYDKILGVDIPKMTLPVAAGRNLSIIVEVAARSYRLKNLGFDTLSKFLK